jgi:hypothetical protein
MNCSRRSFVRLGVGAALSLRANRLLAQQGMGGHTAKPMPRGAPSGRPFNAHLVDVAADAGLHAQVIYGDEETKKYIVESTGCGCAFIDYDNDGWMDLFVLSGTRLRGAPEGTTNRVYRNNRDGTFTDVGALRRKRLRSLPAAMSRTVSPVRFESKICGIAPISCNFQSNPGGFLCTRPLSCSTGCTSRACLPVCMVVR